MTRAWWAVAAYFATALALYGGSLGHPLLFDDEQLTPSFLRQFAADPFGLRGASYATFGWLREIAGANWFWQRLGNVLLHAAVACVLYGFLARLFRLTLAAGATADAHRLRPEWQAFCGALLFLVHPVAVYGAGYLIQRSIVLATLWALASLWLFLEGLERRRARWLAASAAAYFLAVFSKEHAVMLPAVAAALAVLRRGWSPRLAGELALPFVLYAASAAFVTLQLAGLLGQPYERFAADAVRQLPAAAQAPEAHGVYLRSVVNQGFLFFRYLATWLAPWPGAMSIDLRPPFPSQWLGWPQTAGFVGWLAWPVLAVALLLRGGRAGLAGFAMLAPWLLAMTEMVTVRIQEMFVLYRSYLWMCLAPAALPALLGRLRPGWALGLLGAASLALVPASLDRLASFSSSLAVWDDAVRKNADLAAPYVDRAWRNRGVAHYQAGRYAEALADFDRAAELGPANPKNFFQRGALYLRLGRSARALADYDRVLELAPAHQPALARRCVAKIQLRRYDDALADCLAADRLDPNDASNLTSLGMAQALRGATAEAERSYRLALEIEPGAGVVHYQYAVLLRGLGRLEEAGREFAAACRGGVAQACRADPPAAAPRPL